jgi:hypothetical protein
MMIPAAVLLLILCFQLRGADKVFPTVAVHEVTTSSGWIGSAEFVRIVFQFGATLRNSGPGVIPVGAEPLTSGGAEIRDKAGVWKPQSGGLLVEVLDGNDPRPKHKTCTVVQAGDSFEFPEVSTNLVLKKQEYPPSTPIVLRFHLYSLCMQGDKLHWQHLVTEPMEVKVPPAEEERRP